MVYYDKQNNSKPLTWFAFCPLLWTPYDSLRPQIVAPRSFCCADLDLSWPPECESARRSPRTVWRSSSSFSFSPDRVGRAIASADADRGWPTGWPPPAESPIGSACAESAVHRRPTAHDSTFRCSVARKWQPLPERPTNRLYWKNWFLLK